MPATRLLPASPAGRMRGLATGLLAAMAVLFGVAVAQDWPWTRAFAEAGMVGGLADWFAVTALFRHPLGLPIPHTAIIPTNKDRIGDSLAAFLRDNFLTPAIVGERMTRFDAAGAAARLLRGGEVSGRWRQAAARVFGRLVDAFGDEAIAGVVRGFAAARLRATPLAPLLADAVDTVVARRLHVPVIDAAIGWVARTLDEQEGTIRAMVSERTGWVLRLASVDDRVAGSILQALHRLLNEVRADPNHGLRHRLDESLARFVWDLRHLPETAAAVEALKLELLDSPAAVTWLGGLWAGLKPALGDVAGGGAMAGWSARLADALEREPRLRDAVNGYARRAVTGLVADQGDALVALVSETVRGWDASTVTAKLEAAVGRDLQYIRVNGTLIGGLVGLAIHAVEIAPGLFAA